MGGSPSVLSTGTSAAKQSGHLNLFRALLQQGRGSSL